MEPSTGELIETDGAWLRVTVTDLLSDPTELLQATVMTFGPRSRSTVAGLVAEFPLTVQAGAGLPVALKETATDEDVVCVLFEGELIVTAGAWLRSTVTLALSVPVELVQLIWMTLLPTDRFTVVGLVTVWAPILHVGAG